VRGLAEGERVVTAGTFLVDSESRLRSSPQPPKQQPREKAAPASGSKPGLAAHAGEVKDQVKDPACGMMIDREKAVAAGQTLHRDGATYYFCSERCKQNFTREPEHYLALNPPQRRP
jgi:membrane fusion protein, copper/silver efflux system